MLKENILNKIKEKKVKMKPKVFFILKVALTLSALVFCLIFLLYLISFISFCHQANGLGIFNRFGFWGWQRMVLALPWLLILLCLLVLFVLETIAKKFALVWKKPLVISLLVIVAFIFLGNAFLLKVDLHKLLLLKAKNKELPLMGQFYRDIPCRTPKPIQFGSILEKTADGFTLEAENGEVFNVIISPQTRFDFPLKEEIELEEILGLFENEDRIGVAGRKTGSDIEAAAVIKLPPDFVPPPCSLMNLKIFLPKPNSL